MLFCNSCMLVHNVQVSSFMKPLGHSSSAGSVCCFLEQETFTPQKVLVIPRNRWLRLNMTEKLFTGTLNHNQNKQKKNLAIHSQTSHRTSLGRGNESFLFYIFILVGLCDQDGRHTHKWYKPLNVFLSRTRTRMDLKIGTLF